MKKVRLQPIYLRNCHGERLAVALLDLPNFALESTAHKKKLGQFKTHLCKRESTYVMGLIGLLLCEAGNSKNFSRFKERT